MKNSVNNKKIIIISIILLLIVGVVLFLVFNDNKNDVSPEEVVIKFEFYDDFIPGASYNVEIDTNTKILKIHEAHFCSALDCDTRYVDNEVHLTEKEYVLIVKVWKKTKDNDNIKSYFVGALSNIASDDSIMYDSSDSSYESEYDLNNDGIVTDREFGNVYLENIDKDFN